MDKINAYKAIAQIEGVISKFKPYIDGKQQIGHNPDIDYKGVSKLDNNAIELKAYILATNDSDLISRAQGIALTDLEKLAGLGSIEYFYTSNIRGCISALRDITEMNAAPVEPQPAKASGTIPPPTSKKINKKLTSDKAKKYFQKAVDAGLIEESEPGYRWDAEMCSKALLAYFAQKMSDTLGLTKKRGDNEEETRNWKALECALNVPDLKSAKYGHLRTNDTFTPPGWEDVDAIFK